MYSIVHIKLQRYMSIVSVDGQIQRRYTAKIRSEFEMGGKDTVRALGTAAIISDPQMILNGIV